MRVVTIDESISRILQSQYDTEKVIERIEAKLDSLIDTIEAAAGVGVEERLNTLTTSVDDLADKVVKLREKVGGK